MSENMPFQLRNLVMSPYINGYYFIEYNGVRIIVHPDKNKFNATRLLKKLTCDRNARYSMWRSGKSANQLIRSADMEDVRKGSLKIKGVYLDWNLFYPFVYNVATVPATHWLNGEEDWSDIDNSGYLYLVQPQDKLGTDVYKIGRTWNFEQRCKSYGTNVDVISKESVEDMYDAERILLAYFAGKGFERAVRDGLGDGVEYYHIQSKEIAIESFQQAIFEYKKSVKCN